MIRAITMMGRTARFIHAFAGKYSRSIYQQTGFFAGRDNGNKAVQFPVRKARKGQSGYEELIYDHLCESIAESKAEQVL